MTFVDIVYEHVAVAKDVRFKQRAVIEFLSVEGRSPKEIHQRLKMVYREACVDYSTVCRWVSSLKRRDPTETILRDQKRSGRPLSASNAANQKAVDKMILGNRRIKQKNIAKELEISKERVQHIITDILGYRKVSARWVPRMLTDELKVQRKTMCAELLKRYEEEGEEFIQRIVTGDESWVHYYDPESKRQSMEYRHKSSPSPRKFKVVASARKVMLTVFWDSRGIVHMEFLKQGNTVNSERYISTLRKLSVRLKRVRLTKHTMLHHDNSRLHTSPNWRGTK